MARPVKSLRERVFDAMTCEPWEINRQRPDFIWIKYGNRPRNGQKTIVYDPKSDIIYIKRGSWWCQHNGTKFGDFLRLVVWPL